MDKRLMRFIAAISAECKSVRPTVRNTTSCGAGAAEFATTIKDANEALSQAWFLRYGFEKNDIKADGGNGDFSSNVYGTVWKHANGVVVSVRATFFSSPTMFKITVAGWSDAACPWVL